MGIDWRKIVFLVLIQGFVCFFEAARSGQKDCVDLLIKTNADVNVKDQLGSDAFLWCK